MLKCQAVTLSNLDAEIYTSQLLSHSTILACAKYIALHYAKEVTIIRSNNNNNWESEKKSQQQQQRNAYTAE